MVNRLWVLLALVAVAIGCSDVKANSLQDAVMLHDAEAAQGFLDSGADPNGAIGEGGQKTYPVIIAAEAGDLEMLKLLAESSADLKIVDANGGTALHAAARGGDVEVIKWLLGKGLDPAQKDNDGKTPQDLAEEGENSDAAKLLKLE